MAHGRTPSPLSRLSTAVGLLPLLLLVAEWPSTHGFPTNGRELDSAVEGVQRYLESSGFPKMTRGEVLDFLNDFSRGARVSRSEGGKRDASASSSTATVAATSVSVAREDPKAATTHVQPNIPRGESPLNYGYPLSAVTASERPAAVESSSAAPVREREAKNAGAKNAVAFGAAPKKTVGPPVDPVAYAKFKKIPEAKNLKIDDDMRSFLGGFGLLDDAATTGSTSGSRTTDAAAAARRRVDDGATVTETVDAALLKSVLAETGAAGDATAGLRDVLELEASASSARGHVFNPSDPDVRTVDVNRIAKIVENIRLLADDNNTVSLSQEAIQRKLENITAAIAEIDRPPAATTAAAVAASAATATGPNKPFDTGYEVFFDDDSKEVDSDLPESPTGGVAGADADVLSRLPLNEALDPPDPLSTDELQQLLEKNKSDVKRQEPVIDDAIITPSAASSTPAAASSTTAEASTTTTTTTAAASDSSSEATSVEVTSSAAARDSSTAAAADASPSLSQLAESFGGGETASSPPQTAIAGPALPDRPRSGLYFYVDWNSFLTVNQGQPNQVNLRFAPKAGNPAHFIKVNVP